MCTVTYIPRGNSSFILTSNRDEAIDRATLSPRFYDIDGVRMLFPKDVVAGGTWIGVSDKNNMICLLNGGFESHTRLETYKMSRGIIVKELLKADDVSSAIDTFDYNGVEPFTIIAVNWSSHLKAVELVWDGNKAHVIMLSDEPRIWSSSSLYDEKMKQKRRHWFQVFSKENNFETCDLYDFHTTAGEGDKSVDVCMDRGFIKTVSLTQVEKMDDNCVMTYYDLLNNKVHCAEFDTIII